eukprot:7189-Heterococcus_DN1.PRE.2
MEAASKGNDIRGLVSGETYSDISEAVESALAVSADEVCRQMAYHAARDFTNFDPIKMTYIMVYVIAMPGLRRKWRAYKDAQDCKHAVEHERVYLAKQARPRCELSLERVWRSPTAVF